MTVHSKFQPLWFRRAIPLKMHMFLHLSSTARHALFATIEPNQIQGTLSPDSPAASSNRTEIFLLVIQLTVSTGVSSCRIRRFHSAEKCPRALQRVCVYKRAFFLLFVLSLSWDFPKHCAARKQMNSLTRLRGNNNHSLIRVIIALNAHEIVLINCHW